MTTGEHTAISIRIRETSSNRYTIERNGEHVRGFVYHNGAGWRIMFRPDRIAEGRPSFRKALRALIEAA